jgi:exodeoxyribonuclease VII large subunit
MGGMDQLPLFGPLSLSVTELTRYMRQLLESDEVLQNIWVLGEISNLTRHSSGHVYFTLKDSGASLRCVIWKNMAERIRFPLQSGMAIEAHGSIGIYEPRGEYQLYVSSVRPAGEGQLYQEFLRLKTRLESEGYFDPEHKKAIPLHPGKIGIVTSPTGAALQDMLNTLRKRYRLAEIVLCPTAVQGVEAPAEIARALQLLNEREQPDVILLARGGGSLEDLWAFNDERVVKAIFNSKAPIICGVGHETDFTLADFTADLRAPTPTAAAVLATPDSADLKASLGISRYRLESQFQSYCEMESGKLEQLTHRLRQNSPAWLVRNDRQRLDEISARSGRTMRSNLALYRARQVGLVQRLQTLNPFATLQRGYAIVTDEAGKVISKADQVTPGDEIKVRVSEGTFGAKVTGK